MGVTMQSVWTCDGCEALEVLAENYTPKGWVHITGTALNGQKPDRTNPDFVYFVCPTCWTAATWVAEGQPSLTHDPEQSKPKIKPVEKLYQ